MPLHFHHSSIITIPDAVAMLLGIASMESERMSRLMTSTVTKTHQVLGLSLDVFQVSSTLGGKNIERRSCTLTFCDSRSQKRDNGSEMHPQSHHKGLTREV